MLCILYSVYLHSCLKRPQPSFKLVNRCCILDFDRDCIIDLAVSRSRHDTSIIIKIKSVLKIQEEKTTRVRSIQKIIKNKTDRVHHLQYM